MISRRILSVLGGFVALTSLPRAVQSPGMVVHEWGTFTTVAGKDGVAVDWLPLGGRDDLPCFVEHFNDRAPLQLKGVTGAALNGIPDYATARANLIGKVRMETPVLYFYSEQPARVSVHVDFPQGLMTEWFPKATVAQRQMNTASLRSVNGTTWMRWDSVNVVPQSAAHFPKGDEPSHYYQARATDATPLAVGTQAEKFLFYRGVANFDVPLTATVFGDESIRVSNRGKDAIPVVIAFTNRGGKIGYRVERNVSGSVTIPAPLLDRDVATLRQELASILAGEGLFAKEATAMVETWRDTWFEEGTRVFYVFPRATVDAVLPVTIWPKPANMARVFVGRMDVITPAMERDVAAAFKVNDATTLAKYGRVLGPIADRVLADTPLPAERAAISRILNSVLAAQARGGTVCP